ncbi:MAG: hypothetical protein KGH59_01960 [Candidatus Micrarchaeota archaeon]|nr:hypothetical protein [Candidatus Micrarchaeota archaeon]MDE1804529.1 hypothetical protein [Candidatus Micrarchaeota archaeon]MDE1846970.1 hypothetical protein [Candidatus Micrarchaeota archaeon]
MDAQALPRHIEKIKSIAQTLSSDFPQFSLLQSRRGYALCEENQNMIVEVRQTKKEKLELVVYKEPEDGFKVGLLASLRKREIDLIDSGMFMRLINVPGIDDMSGCSFPQLGVLRCDDGFNVHFEERHLKISSKASPTPIGQVGAEYRAYLFHFHEKGIARVIADPNGRWLHNADVLTSNIDLLKVALIEFPDIPFGDFIRKENPDLIEGTWSAESLRMHSNYLREIERVAGINSAYIGTKSIGGWKTTNPKMHRHTNFRYIVHAILEGGELHQFEGDEKDFPEYLSDPFKSPSDFMRRKYISCSVVDQAHTATFADGGFILDVPEQNIRRASPTDLHATVRKDGTEDYESKLPNAYEVLGESHRAMWNEVLISGTSERDGSQIRITGGFVVMDPLKMEVVSDAISRKVRGFCASHSLPVVEISAPIGRVEISFDTDCD